MIIEVGDDKINDEEEENSFLHDLHHPSFAAKWKNTTKYANVKVEGLDTLEGKNYLDGSIITSYINYLILFRSAEQTCHTFLPLLLASVGVGNSVFKGQVVRVTKAMDKHFFTNENKYTQKIPNNIHNKDLLILPIIHGDQDHWVCCLVFNISSLFGLHTQYLLDKKAIFNLQKPTLVYLDSLLNITRIPKLYENMMRFLVFDFVCRHIHALVKSQQISDPQRRTIIKDYTEFYRFVFPGKIIAVEAKVPQQKNGFDCGVFLLEYVDFTLVNVLGNLEKYWLGTNAELIKEPFTAQTISAFSRQKIKARLLKLGAPEVITYEMDKLFKTQYINWEMVVGPIRDWSLLSCVSNNQKRGLMYKAIEKSCKMKADDH